MKTVSSDTPGGRLRDIRLSKKMTLKKFAEYLDTTENYLGLIERGNRVPSQALFKQFASKLGISYDWLMNGDVKQDLNAFYLSARNQRQDYGYLDPIRAINSKLFLALTVMYTDATPETLANILAVPVDVVKKIPNTNDIETFPDWPDTFPALARQINVSALRHDLHNIDVFLKDEENKGIQRYIYRLISKLKTVEEYAKMLENAKVDVPDWQAYTDTSESMDLCIPITVKDAKRDIPVWHFYCYPRLDDIDAETTRDIYDSVVDDLEKNEYAISVVLRSSNAYEKFYDLDSKFEGEAGALAELGESAPNRPQINVIRFDDKTDEYEMFTMAYDDDDYYNGQS